ncbi:hypothetical protein ILYODFUR_036870 [Ilyodon furcidens]|uniref:Uncharacterized protein n=1 Tax=Ilyodon furcidens TaxID=33524 RepID=A0ABV0U1Y6_9TELE
MPPGRLPREVFQARPTGRSPGDGPGHAGGTMSLSWPGNALGSTRRSWRRCLGRGTSGCLYCCPHDPVLEKTEDDEYEYNVIPYIAETSEKVSIIFFKHNIPVNFRPNQTNRQRLCTQTQTGLACSACSSVH